MSRSHFVKPLVKGYKIQTWHWYLFWLISARLRVVERLRNFTFWWFYDNLCELTGIVVSWSDICYQYFMLDRAIHYFIEHFDYFLVCSQINAVILWMSEKEYWWSQEITLAFFFYCARPSNQTETQHTHTNKQAHTHTHTHTHKQHTNTHSVTHTNACTHIFW